MRARMSAVPPAANGLTMRTGRVGQSWATANVGTARRIEASSNRTTNVMMRVSDVKVAEL
jgi:hypothetical protein